MSGVTSIQKLYSEIKAGVNILIQIESGQSKVERVGRAKDCLSIMDPDDHDSVLSNDCKDVSGRTASYQGPLTAT